MQAHAHAQSVDAGEVFFGQRALRIDRGGDRIVSGMEGGAKHVAHQFEDISAVSYDRSAHQLLLAGNSGFHRVGMRFPALRRAFDV
jgi:hypothetical protein